MAAENDDDDEINRAQVVPADGQRSDRTKNPKKSEQKIRIKKCQPRCRVRSFCAFLDSPPFQDVKYVQKLHTRHLGWRFFFIEQNYFVRKLGCAHPKFFPFLREESPKNIMFARRACLYAYMYMCVYIFAPLLTENPRRLRIFCPESRLTA